LLGILGASALIYQIVRWRSRVPVAQ
jgi:hypothetical protein